jgi:hypothetical protein
MLLHASLAACHVYLKIMIRTVDIYVIVLFVSVTQTLQLKMNCGLHLELNMFQYLAAHIVATGQGLERLQALPVSQCLTGCDTLQFSINEYVERIWKFLANRACILCVQLQHFLWCELVKLAIKQ